MRAARFDQANRFGIRQQVKRELSGDAAVEQLVLRLPRFFHRQLIDFERARIVADHMA